MVELRQGLPPYSGVFISRPVGSIGFYYNKYVQGVGWFNGHGGYPSTNLLQMNKHLSEVAERDMETANTQNREWTFAREPDLFDL